MKVLRYTAAVFFGVFFIGSVSLFAQDAVDEKITVPLTNPADPVLLAINWGAEGNVRITGYDGTQVEVEMRSEDSGRRSRDRGRSGLRRLNVGGGKLNVRERRNRVTVSHGHGGEASVEIRVPRHTSIRVETNQDSNIYIENVIGEIDAKNLNGDLIEIINVSGTVLANSLNGEIRVVMDSVDTDKPMSFRAINGDIDVTFPADLKATLDMQNTYGEVWIGFDDNEYEIKTKWEKENLRNGASYSKNSIVAINGGGVDISFYGLNDDIIIRKKRR